MDLFPAKLASHASKEHSQFFHLEKTRPNYIKIFSRFFLFKDKRRFQILDRIINRHFMYPLLIKSVANKYDGFHVCDHSYAHLLSNLPQKIKGVYCHDLDAFLPLINPKQHRGLLHAYLAKRLMLGMKEASLIFYSSQTIKREIERHQLFKRTEMIHAPLGTSKHYTWKAKDNASYRNYLPREFRHKPFLLNVGQCIPRKRVEWLLEVFYGVLKKEPNLRLIQVGGFWTKEQLRIIHRLKLANYIFQTKYLEEPTLASFYRNAEIVVQPSKAEGFGMPIIEALACGAKLIVSDIPIFREIANDAAIFCPLDDLNRWITTVYRTLNEQDPVPNLKTRLKQASIFSWDNHSRIILDAYQSKF